MVNVGLGFKKKIAFNTVFHDQPWGVQTHAYAPLGVDLRNKYTVGGSQLGEPRECKELGVDTPADGLYIREDTEIICSVPLTSKMVKSETQRTIGVMVERIARKAELLDEGKLHAIFEEGRLKTSKPCGEVTFNSMPLPSPASVSPGIPQQVSMRPDDMHYQGGKHSPPLDSKGFGRYHDIVGRGENVRRHSPFLPQYQPYGHHGLQHANPQHTNAGAEMVKTSQGFVCELPGSVYRPQQHQSIVPSPLQSRTSQGCRAELPGDDALQPMQTPPSVDQKSQSPLGSDRPAHQQLPHSGPTRPQNGSSPRAPHFSHGRTSHSSNYRIANPDPENHESSDFDRSESFRSTSDRQHRGSNGHAFGSAPQPLTEAHLLSSDSPTSRYQSQHMEPDEHRFDHLSLRDSHQQPSGPTMMTKCPGRSQTSPSGSHACMI